MQHASDLNATALIIVALSVIILAKILSAQGAIRRKMSWPDFILFGLAIAATIAADTLRVWHVNAAGVLVVSNIPMAWVVRVEILDLAAIAVFIAGIAQGVPTIRRIAGLNAIDEAVGRATEMGRPVMMVPGISGLDIISLQALNIFSHIAKSVAKFGNRTILPVIDPPLVGVAEEVIRDAYTHAGRPELFNSDDVRFLSDRQFSYAAGTAGLMERENVAATFLMGAFYAEALILSETGQRIGAIQVAATPQTTQLPFFIASCDYVLLGDEFYAASAYLSKNPTLLGSIVGQDYCKLSLLIAIVLGTAAASAATFVHAGHGHPAASTLHAFLHRFINWFTT